jgi:hypothetical protein
VVGVREVPPGELGPEYFKTFGVQVKLRSQRCRITLFLVDQRAELPVSCFSSMTNTRCQSEPGLTAAGQRCCRHARKPRQCLR